MPRCALLFLLTRRERNFVPDQLSTYSAFHEPGSDLTLPFKHSDVIEITELRTSAKILLCGGSDNSALPATNRIHVLRVDCTVYGLAPDRWLAVYSKGEADPAEFTSTKLFSTDHSGAWASLQVSGHKSQYVLQRLCPVDLHPSVFEEGMCFQSRLGGNPALVRRIENVNGSDCFHVHVPRSSARALLEDLADTSVRV